MGEPVDSGAAAASAARRAEIAANLAEVRQRIATACRKAGRDPAEITVVAVTKTRPAEDVLHLAAVGVLDIGENRDQEAAPKAVAVRAAGADVRWHFVGRLQRNKCPSVVRYASVVHSVDSRRLAAALATAAQRRLDPRRGEQHQGGQRQGDQRRGDQHQGDQHHRDGPLDVLVQVSLDGDPSRGGAVASGPYAPAGPRIPAGSGAANLAETDAETDLAAVIDQVVGAEALAFRGLMAVAPLGWEPARAFAVLADIAAAVRRDHPQATILSAGMSGDIEEAIDYGATHVRVGSALLGNRPPLM